MLAAGHRPTTSFFYEDPERKRRTRADNFDLPAEDLAMVGRVLSTVFARANAQLAGASRARP